MLSIDHDRVRGDSSSDHLCRQTNLDQHPVHQRIVSITFKVHGKKQHLTRYRLKTRGISISKEGVSVKTDKRFDRERYLDATQRYVSISD